MKLTNQAIFWKCWLWSVITGGVVATLFWMVCNVGNFFRGDEGGTIFVTILLILSIVGSYAGAGVVGWRIAEKYYARTVDSLYDTLSTDYTGETVIKIKHVSILKAKLGSEYIEGMIQSIMDAAEDNPRVIMVLE